MRCSLKLLATPSKLRVRFEDLLAVFHLRTSVFIPMKGLATLMHVRDAVGRGLSSCRDASALAFFFYLLLLLPPMAALSLPLSHFFFVVGVVVVEQLFSPLISFQADDLCMCLSLCPHTVPAHYI